MTVLAWHGSADLKAATVARMKLHRDHDELIAGSYLDFSDLAQRTPSKYRGCFHGCLTAERLSDERGVPVNEVDLYGDVSWHEEAQRLYGIPVEVGALLDSVFESLDDQHGAFAVQTLAAIPVGADLTAVDVERLWQLVEPPDVDGEDPPPPTDDEAIAAVCAALAAAPMPAAQLVSALLES